MFRIPVLTDIPSSLCIRPASRQLSSVVKHANRVPMTMTEARRGAVKYCFLRALRGAFALLVPGVASDAHHVCQGMGDGAALPNTSPKGFALWNPLSF
ncbi:MAG: hypothetical protein RBU37_14420 [Myxococcota bacterium]|nr:hypothetical protein [Myxococcota bacterium]